jgi:hypothetical protein
MADNKNAIDIAVLLSRFENHVDDDDKAWAVQAKINTEILDCQKALLQELHVFTTTLRAGKWIFGALLMALGAFGHKGLQWAISLFYGN